jgi:hypothetical protein
LFGSVKNWQIRHDAEASVSDHAAFAPPFRCQARSSASMRVLGGAR